MRRMRVIFLLLGSVAGVVNFQAFRLRSFY